MADKIKVWPVRGTEAQILAQPYYDGKLYFAYDTNKIYLDVKGSKHLMGGGNSGIVYANGTGDQVKKLSEDDNEFNYSIALDALDNANVEPQANDLILNSDGRFFRVISVDSAQRLVYATLLAVSGTGGGGGGGGSPIVTPGLTIVPDTTTVGSSFTYVSGQHFNITFTVNATTDDDTADLILEFFSSSNVNTTPVYQINRRGVNIGEPVNIDISEVDYIGSGITLRIKAESAMSEAPATRIFSNIRFVTMGIQKVSTETYIPVITSENLSGLALSYIPLGDSALTETLHVYIDGEEDISLRKTLTRDNYDRSNSVSIPTQEHGVHKVNLSVSTVVNGAELFSDMINFEAAWAADDNDTPIIWVGDYNPLVVNYESASIPFMVFNPEDYRQGRASDVILFKNGLQISEIKVAYNPNGWEYWDISAIYEVGNNLLTIQQGITSKEINIEVTTEGSRDLGLVRENTLLVNFTSAGRSPSELITSRNKWTSHAYFDTEAQLEGFNWANNGWISPTPDSKDYANGAYLSIANGASLTIPMRQYSLNNAQDYSFEIRFRVRNVQKYSTLVTTIPTYFYETKNDDGTWTPHTGEDDGVTMEAIENSNGTMRVIYDDYGSPWMNDNKLIQDTNTTYGIVCRWIDPATGYGFVVGTQEAFFKSPAKLVSVRYKEDEIINISFVVSVAQHLAYIYLNGIPSGAVELPVNAQGNPEPFNIASNMTFNSEYCDFDLYRVRIYQYGLTIPDVIHNYLSDIHSISLYDQNQLTLATDATQLDYNKLVKYNEDHPDEPTMPYATWKISKNDEFGRDTLPYYKGDKRTVDVTFVNPPLNAALDKKEITPWYYYTHTPGYTSTGVEIDVQGTSSQAYPRRNYKTKFKKAKTWVFNYGPLEGQSVAADHYFDKSNGEWIGEEAEKQGAEESKDAYKARMKAYNKLSKKLHVDTENVSTNKFTWKIDYMESSGMYNTGFANLMGNLQHPLYLKHPLEDLGLPADEMRTSVYGFPLLTFHEYADGSYEYIGRYNMNIDKSSNEYYGFEDENEHPFVPGKTVANVAECWELEDNQGSWCSFKFPTDAARETGFGTLQDGSADRIEIMRHFEYRYSKYGDQFDAIGPEGEYDGSLPSDPAEAAAMIAEIGTTDAEKSFYVRNKLFNLEKVFYWLDSTNTDAATNENIIIRTPVMNEDGSVTINKEYPEYVEYPTSVDYTGVNGAVSTLSGNTYITKFYKDSVAYRQAKFVNEVSKHFDLHYCIIYFIMTELLLCYDSRGKNMMLATWGPHEVGGDFIWYPIFYDIDTQLGLNNSGAYLWDYDADVTMDRLFSTPSSVLWTNLYNLFLKDIQGTYGVLRGRNDNSKIVNSLTYTNIIGAYECNSDVFKSYAMAGLRPIVAIGLDEYYKYFATTTASGIGYYDTKGNLIKEATPSYAYCCQGDKKLNTELLLRNRLNYIDSWWMGGDYQIDKVKNSELWLRVSGNRSKETSDTFLNLSTEEIAQRQIPDIPENADDAAREAAIAAAAKYQGFSHGDYAVPYLDSVPGFKIKPFLKQYVSFYTDQVPGPTTKYNDTAEEQDGVWTPVSQSVTATYKNDPESPNSQLCYIPGTDYISSLGDLSISYIDEFHLNRGIRLLDLNLGSDHPSYYNNLIVPSKFELKDSVGDMETNIHKPLLKKVLLNHLRKLSTSIDLSASAKLQEFRALDTPITGAKFAAGAPLHTVHLPNTVNSLSLIESSDLDRLLTSAPVVATVDDTTGKLVYADPATYRGLYIQDVTDNLNTGTGSVLSTLTIQGGHLRYGSYALLKRLVDLKNGATINNRLAASLTDVQWTPYELVAYGMPQGDGPYYQLTDHSTFVSYTNTDPDTWKELTLNEKIYTRDTSIDTSSITSLELLDTFLSDYNRPSNESQQFVNTSGSTNRTTPTLSGNMYIENTRSTPVDEAALTNVYRTMWPDLVIRAAYVNESYIAKYIQILDSGKEEEIDVIRYAQGTGVQVDLTNKTPSKQYYDFKGWGLDKNGEQMFATYDATTKVCTIVNPQTFSEGNDIIVLYAIFENHPYNVKFYDYNGTYLTTTYSTYGTVVKDPNISPSTDESALALTETYKFKGWSKEPINPNNVTDKVLRESIVTLSNINVTKDMNFYAVYKKQDVHDEITNMDYFTFESSPYVENDLNGQHYDPAYVSTAYNVPNGVAIGIKPGVLLSGKITLPLHDPDGNPVVRLNNSFRPYGNNQYRLPTGCLGGQEITHIFFDTVNDVSEFRYLSDSCLCSDTGRNAARGKLEYFEFPSSMRRIDGGVFFYAKSLKTLTLPEGLRFVGNSAFNGAFVDQDFSYKEEHIDKIHLPGSLAGIGVYAFSNINSATVGEFSIGDSSHGSVLSRLSNNAIMEGENNYPASTIFGGSATVGKLVFYGDSTARVVKFQTMVEQYTTPAQLFENIADQNRIFVVAEGGE